MKQKETHMPSALDRGLALLEILVRSKNPMTFGALVQALGDLNRATLSRMLKGLVEGGYVDKNPESGLYSPGYRMAVFASIRSQGLGTHLLSQYAAFMDELSTKWDVTVILLERVNGALINIRKVQTQTSPYMQDEGFINDHPGQPWTQVLYAYAPKTMPARLPKALSSALSGIRERGYDYDDQTLRENFRRIGFPLLDHTGELIGVLGVGGSILQITDASMPKICSHVQKAHLNNPA